MMIIIMKITMVIICFITDIIELASQLDGKIEWGGGISHTDYSMTTRVVLDYLQAIRKLFGHLLDRLAGQSVSQPASQNSKVLMSEL